MFPSRDVNETDEGAWLCSSISLVVGASLCEVDSC